MAQGSAFPGREASLQAALILLAHPGGPRRRAPGSRSWRVAKSRTAQEPGVRVQNASGEAAGKSLSARQAASHLPPLPVRLWALNAASASNATSKQEPGTHPLTPSWSPSVR